jgi:hypothetical protein
VLFPKSIIVIVLIHVKLLRCRNEKARVGPEPGHHGWGCESPKHSRILVKFSLRKLDRTPSRPSVSLSKTELNLSRW